MVPDRYHADRPLSLVLAGQSIKHETLAAAVQTLLQPSSAEPSVRRSDSCRGGVQLDSARLNRISENQSSTTEL